MAKSMTVADNASSNTSTQGARKDGRVDNFTTMYGEASESHQPVQSNLIGDSLITATASAPPTLRVLSDYSLADVQAANRLSMTALNVDLPDLGVTSSEPQQRSINSANTTGGVGAATSADRSSFADRSPSGDRQSDAPGTPNNNPQIDLATKIKGEQQEIDKLRKLSNRTVEQTNELNSLQTGLSRDVQDAVARRRQLEELEVSSGNASRALTPAQNKEHSDLLSVLRTERQRRIDQLAESAPRWNDAGGAAGQNTRGGDNTQNFIYLELMKSMDKPMKALNGRSPHDAGYTLVPTRASSNLDEAGFDFILIAKDGTVLPLDASRKEKTELPELRQKGVIVSDPHDPSLPDDDRDRQAARRENIRLQFDKILEYLKKNPSRLSIEDLRLPSPGSVNQESPTNNIDNKIEGIRRIQDPELRMQKAEQLRAQLDARRQEMRNYIADLQKLGDHLKRMDDLDDAKRVRQYADQLNRPQANREGPAGPLGFLNAKIDDLTKLQTRAQIELQNKKPGDRSQDRSATPFYDDHIDDPVDLEGLWNPNNKLSKAEKAQTASETGSSPSVLQSEDARNFFFFHTEDAFKTFPSLQQLGQETAAQAEDVSLAYSRFRTATMLEAHNLAKPGEDMHQLAKKLEEDVKKNPDELGAAEQEALKRPRELYQQWVDAREKFAHESKDLNSELEVRRQAIQQRINDFNEEHHLPPVKLVLNQKPGTAGLYKRGQGIVEIPPEAIYDAKSFSKVIPTIYHELVHNEQDALVTQNLIDEVARKRNLDNASLSNPENLAEIQRLFLERTKAPLSAERLQQVLESRNGQYLNADQAKKAQALEQSFTNGRMLPDDYSLSGNDFRMCKRDLNQLNDVANFPDAGKDIMRALVDDAYLRQHLFGNDSFEALPQSVRDYALKARQVRDGAAQWSAEDETGSRKLLAESLQQRIQQINDYRRESWSKYRDNLHEREAAWVTEDMATTIRENSELIAGMRAINERDNQPRTSDRENDQANDPRRNQSIDDPRRNESIDDLDLRGKVEPPSAVENHNPPKVDSPTEFHQTAGGGEQMIIVRAAASPANERTDSTSPEDIAKLEDAIINDDKIPVDVKINSVTVLELAKDPANIAARRAVVEARNERGGGRAAEIEGAGMGIAALALMLGEWYLQSNSGRSRSNSDNNAAGRYH